MTAATDVTLKDFNDMLAVFAKKSFDAASCEEGSIEDEIMKKSMRLFRQDYSIIEVDNKGGTLSPRYPSRILIPEYEHGHMASTLTPNSSSILTQSTSNTKTQNNTISNNLHNTSCSNVSPSTTTTANSNLNTFATCANPTMQHNQQKQQPQQSPYDNSQTNFHYQQQASNVPAALANTTTNTIYEDLYDITKIRELMLSAKYARCRQRFVVPVIMYRGKYICRSATISHNAETYGRKVFDYAYDYLSRTNYSDRGSHNVDDENNDNQEESLMNQALNENSPFSYDDVIKNDVQLLNALNVTTIVDLMVEKRKIKYFLAVTSSEKVDPDHYEHFNLLSLPYPGCEFFKKFRDNNYTTNNLHYDWKQAFNDATICIPQLRFTKELNINWSEYQTWDLVLITQNYLKACLRYIQEEKSGLLVHCISGWDRTPLFISLIRLSLWADGLIHQSLNPLQITYFSVAYDWYLFGHQLPDRLKRQEDIMLFCFHVLKHIVDEEFSIVEHRKRTKTSSSCGSNSSTSSCSVIVLKSDSCDGEPLKEDFILDQDSNESISNSSICDISITDNFYSTAIAPASAPHSACNTTVGINTLTNRSPNAKRSRTSPILVPGQRQRHESTSSTGSWQVVSDSGSIDSMMNSSCITNLASRLEESSRTGDNTPKNSGNGTNAINNANTKEQLPSTGPAALLRKQRLSAVRSIFKKNYGKAVGLQFQEGSGSTLVGRVVDNFTEHVF